MKTKRFSLREMLKISNKTRKVFLLLAAVVMCFCMTNEAVAQTVASGTTGSCTWTVTGISGNYTLTISGTGTVENYYPYIPWYSYLTSIKTVDIQQGVTTIGNEAFSNCSGLTSVTIPNSVTSIGESAFSNCSGLTYVTIPNSVTSIGNYAFSNCRGLTSVTIPNSVTSIGNSAFSNCSGLTSVTIPNSVTSIGESAFFNCSGLTSVTIGNSVTSIGNSAFYDCRGLTSVTIGNSVTSIGNYAFYDCNSLTSVTIGNSVTSIGDSAFSNCRGLTSVTIPNSVTSIGNSAFSGCSGLTDIYAYRAMPPTTYANSTFWGINKFSCILHVPEGSAQYYSHTAAAGWNEFFTIKEDAPLISGIESIESGKVRIYPNPVKESFRIDGLTAQTQVSVTDINGRTVLKQTVEVGESISIAHLPQGIYLVRMNGESMKIIKSF